MTQLRKTYADLIACLDLDRLQAQRPGVEARMKRYQDLENSIGVSAETLMLDVIDRRIAALRGDMFYIVVDETHRIELTPRGNFYPQRLVQGGAGTHYTYYHLAQTRLNRSTQIRREEYKINQIHYRTETAALNYILTH
jgi:hypothetical protein